MQKSLARNQVSWIGRNWRMLVLLSVVSLGTVCLATYKVYVAWENWAFVFLVFFTEVAAGVAVLAQALLRKQDKKIANKGFVGSIVVRVLLALIGVALFVEAAEGTTDSFPYVLPGAVSWTAFFTYELGSMAILLIEWLFSHMLKHENYDTHKALVDTEAALEEARGKLADLAEKRAEADGQIYRLEKEAAEAADAIADITGAYLEAGKSLAAAIREMAAAHHNHAEGIRKEAEKGKHASVGLLAVAEGIRLAMEGKPKKAGEVAEDLGQILERAGLSPNGNGTGVDISGEALRSLAIARDALRTIGGRSFTVRTNVQAYYCQACYAYNELGRGREKKCEKCGTVQGDKK